MVVVNKIKQLEGKTLRELVLLAKADGLETEMGIAQWIIAHSVPWKSKGYYEILKAIKEGKLL